MSDTSDFQKLFSTIIEKQKSIKLSPTIKDKKSSEDIRDELNVVRNEDIKGKIRLRVISAAFFALLLGGQNYMVFKMCMELIKQGALRDNQAVLGVITSATLFETYKITEIMVKWLFKDIKYDYPQAQ